MENKKVLLGMSGGVDSSVAAILLQEAGYEVVGAMMKLWEDGKCGNDCTYTYCQNDGTMEITGTLMDDYETVEDYINTIIYDHNYLRPSYALNYKTPIEYRTQQGFK